METVIMPFIFTLVAGLAMGIGGLLGFVGEGRNKNFFYSSVGFAAGVMLYAAFVEVLPESFETLSDIFGEKNGVLYTTIGFFIGIIFMLGTEKFCLTHQHHDENHIEKEDKAMYRMGIMTAIAIAIHNFPEGLAIFTSALKDTKLGLSVTLAIIIHNIAVGIAISAPIYYGTGNKKKALGAALLSGLSEPLGAILGYWILKDYLNDVIFGILLSIVAGVMVYISLDELIPSAQKGDSHTGTYSLVFGMFVMALTIICI